MVSRRRLQAVALASVLLVVVAFAFVDVAVASHRIDADHRTSTASVGDATMSVPDEVALYVVAPEGLRKGTEAALVDALAARGVDATVAGELSAHYDRPALLVGIRESRFAYDPITPSATVALTFEYAPSGNVTQFGRGDDGFDPALVDEHLATGDHVPLRLGGEDVLFRGGDVELADATTGVVTWPGYRRHVLAAVAEHAVAQLFADAA